MFPLYTSTRCPATATIVCFAAPHVASAKVDNISNPYSDDSLEEYWELSDASYSHLQTLQKKLEDTFHLSKYQHFHISQTDRQLVWSNSGKAKVVATVQFVGEVWTDTHTWEWSWANPSILPEMKRDIDRIKVYGIAHHLNKLTKQEWHADRSDGWDMTAIAVSLLKAKGAYCAPDKEGLGFLVITDIHWAYQQKDPFR